MVFGTVFLVFEALCSLGGAHVQRSLMGTAGEFFSAHPITPFDAITDLARAFILHMFITNYLFDHPAIRKPTSSFTNIVPTRMRP